MRTGFVWWPGRRDCAPPGPALDGSEWGTRSPRVVRWLGGLPQVSCDAVDVGQRQRCTGVSLFKDLPGLITVQWLGALGPVVVQDPVVDLVVDLLDQVVGL